MNQAVKLVSEDLNLEINEFCVVGMPHQGRFAHQWYVGTNRPADESLIKETLDKHLKALNDDYAVERNHALKDIMVTVLPNQTFIDFLESKNKLGGQSKFPRVLKGKNYNEWQAFLLNHKK
jgi:hypothetical protein